MRRAETEPKRPATNGASTRAQRFIRGAMRSSSWGADGATRPISPSMRNCSTTSSSRSCAPRGSKMSTPWRGWNVSCALRKLNHPVIARGFGGVLKGERPHICVEFLEGPRLSTLIRKFGPLPLEQLIPLAVELCSALHYMHARRMVHLDVKPKNIIMGAPPRLIDLSIARSFRDAAALDVAVGTDAYMAPEQCVPTPGHVGAPADIWGLGVTLHEAVTGEIPFPRGSDDRHPQIKLAPPPLDG